MRDSNPRGYETSFAYAQLARSRSPTELLAARRDGPHTLACGSSSQQRFTETLVDPASPARGCTPGNSRSSPRWWSRISLPALLARASFAPAKLGRVSRATRDLTRSLRCTNNFLRLRARAQLFLSSLQFPYKIPAGKAQRDFPCPHESSCTSCNLLGQKALAGFLRTSYPRSRSANSAKNRLGVCKTPILLRKTAVLAAYSHPT